jgi:sodium-coupled neutral amino acid transporter 11
VAFGPAGFRFVLVNMFIMAYGAMVTYLMITKDCASLLLLPPPPAGEDPTSQQQLLLLAVSLTIQLPLACLRDMADLEKISGVAVLIDCTIVALVVVTSPWERGVEAKGGWLHALQNDIVHYDTIFVGLGVLSFAFECQEAAFLVAGSLERPTARRWATVTAVTLTCCAALALACGASGYFGYLDETKGNVLDNLDPTLRATLAAQASKFRSAPNPHPQTHPRF